MKGTTIHMDQARKTAQTAAKNLEGQQFPNSLHQQAEIKP
jgi:hypothetical protein